jgi:hypothetical protein
MSRGFLIFANNNEQIDYVAIALCNALMIKSNLGPDIKVCLVTSDGDHGWLVKSRGEALVNRAFDDIIIRPYESDGNNTRKVHDTLSTAREVPWKNATRAMAYHLSPYDETILIDADYLVMDKTLDQVWDSPEAFRINTSARKINQKPLQADEARLEPFGLKMAWATCVYFRKTPEVKIIFDMVDHVRENYAYYQHLYRFPGRLFRNDYAFSIAMHIMNGWTEGLVAELPAREILTSFDCDELISVPRRNEFIFLINDETHRYKFTVANVKGINVHIMNKFSIGRHIDQIVSLYGDE